MSRLDLVEAALLTLGKKCVRRGDKITAQCPAHDDRSPSFHAILKGDAVLFHCFSGCDGVSIMDALGLRWDQIKPDDYRQESYRAQRKDDLDVDQLIVQISRSDRAVGKRQSEKDKQSELAAFERLRSRGVSVVEGMPVVSEIVRGASGANRQA